MTAPKDRTELLELMAVSDCGGPDEFDDIGYELRRAYREAAIRILDAIEAAGCVVVPVEPSQDMSRAACEEFDAMAPHAPEAGHVWTAMVDASPYRKELP